MTQTDIQIPLRIIQQLLSHAQSSIHTEVCGVISSLNGHISHCYPIKNSHLQPQQHFTLDPHEQISTFKSLREKGEQLFAIYHSHPHSSAYPSAEDLTLANYPDSLYFIISLKTKGILELRGFRLINHHAQEVTLLLRS